MASVDLKDMYLQVLIYPESQKYLYFISQGKVFQFKVLCFSIMTTTQLFIKDMAPVSVFLHQAGIQILRYVDNW